MSITKSLLFLLPILFFAQPALSAYDPNISLEYVYASALAYCDTNSIQSWNCGEVCQNLTGYQVELVQTFNIASEQSLVLVLLTHPDTKRFLTIFRGTVGAVELIVEIMQGSAVPFELFNITNATADDYFYIHYTQQLRPVVTDQLKKAYATYPDYQYVFTGHSLGGAFATLSSFDMVSSDVIPASQVIVYNYGSPRVGNQVLAEAIQTAVPEIYRVVHWRDIVPHVPPCQVSGGVCVPSSTEAESRADGILWPAWHVTQEIFYDENCSSYVTCDGAEDPKCSDQFSLTQTLVMEHLKYLNVSMVCGSITAYGKDGMNLHEKIVSEEMKSAVEDAMFWKNIISV